MRNFNSVLLVCASSLVLTACGADSIASPGGSNVNISVTPAPTPTPTPTPTPVAVTPAGACPSLVNDGSVVLANDGTISGPTGTYRVCTLPSLIRKTVTLPKITGLVYRMNGRVDVGCDGGPVAPTAGASYVSTTIGCTAAPLTADTNVTLNIEPGVILYGEQGASWLAVNRGNKINAAGSASRPIIFTSADNVAGLNTESTGGGQWGGVVLLGRGRVSDCQDGLTAPCQRDTEGAVNKAYYGGTDDSYNAGRLSYVQIRYSGFVLSNNRELQGLTPGGIGSGTTLDHIQIHRSSDDGAEFFGGVSNVKYYIATAADDDSVDVDTGARVNMQYVMLLPVPGEGDALMEIDSNGLEAETPRTDLRVTNFLGAQPQTSSNNESGGARAATHFRGNADVKLYNGAIIAPNNECIRLTSNTTTALRATLVARSVLLQCSAAKYIGDGTGASGTVTGDGEFTNADVAAAFGAGSNNNSDTFMNTLTLGYFNGTNENAVPTTDPTALSAFFTASPTPFRIGAAWAENNTWYTGWTCNSTVANFGTTSTACTSLPTT